jgi:hypothetical protein
LYSPAGSSGSTKKPASVVLRDVSTPVAILVAVTVAFVTSAPEGSVTAPWIDPVPPTWAKLDPTHIHKTAQYRTRRMTPPICAEYGMLGSGPPKEIPDREAVPYYKTKKEM